MDTKEIKGSGDSEDSKKPVFDPPPYAPPAGSSSSSVVRRRPHTNAVIEAGNVRARDEVCFSFTSLR